MKWTYDNVHAVASRFEYWADFRAQANVPYSIACKHPQDFPWLKHKKHGGGYWTHDRVVCAASTCTTFADFFHRYGSAYGAARKNGWLDELTWLRRKFRWTKEAVLAESRKYAGKGRTAFKHGNQCAYITACRNGWLDEMPWIGRVDNPYTTPMHCAYKYVFVDQHAVYVGITMDASRRDYAHRVGHHGESAVHRFASQCGVPVPPMLIVANGLRIDEAQRLEDTMVRKCKADGWLVLNKAHTGVGTGSIGMAARKWTQARVMMLSKSFTSPKQFENAHPTAYEKARRLGWLSDMWWLYGRKTK